MVDPSRRLADDHFAIDQVLNELKASLANGDVEKSHAKLDLFWARLAVHIRAEHLHLFPAVVAAIREKPENDTSGPVPKDAEAAVEQLLDDHEFFMRELAAAVQTIRKLGKFADTRIDLEGLKGVQNIVLEIERRLVRHNDLEENKVYRWTNTVLSEQRQHELTTEIERELGNKPPRFSQDVWRHS